MFPHFKKPSFFFVLLLLIPFVEGQLLQAQELSKLLGAQGIQNTKPFDFHGYAGVQFKLENGTKAKIVVPKQPASGKPWIWRARFWEHQPALDLELLKNGYSAAVPGGSP